MEGLLIPKRRFYKRVPVEAKLSVSKEDSVTASVILEYSSTGEGELKGHLLGDAAMRGELDRLIEHGSGRLKFEGKTSGLFDKEYSSPHASLSFSSDWLDPLFGPNLPKTMHRKIADVRFDMLGILQKNYYGDDASEESANIVFAGDTGLLRAILSEQLRGAPYDPRALRQVAEIDLPECFSKKMVVTSTDHEEWEDSYAVRVSKRLIGVDLTPIKNHARGEDPQQKYLVLADQLSAICSFLLGRRTRWSRASFRKGRSRLTWCVNAPPEPREADRFLSYPVRLLDKPTELLVTGLESMQRSEAHANDMMSAIDFVVEGELQSKPENRFTLFAFALERLKGHYESNLSEQSASRIFECQEFRQIRSSIEEILADSIHDKTKLDLVKAKLAVLNQWPFQKVVERMMREWNVAVEDLYPPGVDITLFSTRNKLVHSARDLDPNQLYADQERLKILVQRLILRRLGWSDLSRTPEPWVKNWLTKPSNSGGR